MVKKYTSLLLVAMLVIHLAGFYVYFIVRLGDLRMTMREKLAELPVEALDIVRIPLDKFKPSWMKEREMKWQGRMYDIAHAERDGQTMVVYCIQDKDEDDLLSLIEAVIDMSHQDTQKAPNSVTQFFTLEYILTGIACPVRPVRTIKITAGDYHTSFASVILLPISPPPRA